MHVCWRERGEGGKGGKERTREKERERGRERRERGQREREGEREQQRAGTATLIFVYFAGWMKDTLQSLLPLLHRYFMIILSHIPNASVKNNDLYRIHVYLKLIICM